MIYTGCFNRLREYQAAGLTPIAISVTISQGYTGLRMKELSPDKDMVYLYKQKALTGLEFTKEYQKKLKNVKWAKIFKKWESLGDVILLCYEPSGFCHRHILAKYLTEEGIEVKEYEETDCRRT